MRGDFEKFPRQEFIAFWRKHETTQRSLLFLGCYIAGMVPFAIAGPFIEEHKWIAFLWFPLFFGYLIAFPMWFGRTRAREDQRFLKCPACSTALMGARHLVVTATGKCGTCGEEICA